MCEHVVSGWKKSPISNVYLISLFCWSQWCNIHPKSFSQHFMSQFKVEYLRAWTWKCRTNGEITIPVHWEMSLIWKDSGFWVRDAKWKSGSLHTQIHTVGTHTNTHMSNRSCSSSNKLVGKAGEKWARAHCPGIRDEQRCENVTTNSPRSPNVTFPLHSLTLPSSCLFLGSLLSNPPLLPFSSTRLILPYAALFLCPPLLSSHPLTLLSFLSPQKGREGKEAE